MVHEPDETTSNRTAVAAKGGCASVMFRVVSLGFMVGGLSFVLFYGVPDLRQAAETWNWTTTQGRIIKSTIGRDEGSFWPEIVHQFEVNGTSYESDTIWIGSLVGLPSQQRARDIAKRYPSGKEVNVYYDPTDPQRAVLERGVHATTLFNVYFGAAFFGIGLLMFLLRKAVSRRVVSSAPLISTNSRNL